MQRIFHYNNKSLLNRRRQLRNNASPPEILLWLRLKKSQLGYKFIRQYSVDGYVLDFFCPSLRLAIEVDGKYHQTQEQTKYDLYRDKWIASHDIKVLRLPAKIIMENIEQALNQIVPLLKQEGVGSPKANQGVI